MLSARDLPLLPVFVAVASSGSFTAAARRLGLGKSVVSQHVKTLEERCGVRLIERSTRHLHLTQVGEQVLDAANQLLSAFHSLEQVVEGHRERPTGTLRLTCPLDVGLSSIIGSVATALTRRYPELKVDLVFDDAVHDLVDEGFDLALRLNVLAESSYVVRRIGAVPEIIVSSQAMVDQLPHHDDPSVLADAPWVAHTGLKPRSTWTFRSEQGARQQVRVDLRATVNTSSGIRDLLIAGAGFAVAPMHMVRDDLKAGRLMQVCPGWLHRKLALHAVMPTRRPPPRVRAFLSAIVDEARTLGIDAI
jgi:DNA-binding transcriptional LysR family regulator